LENRRTIEKVDAKTAGEFSRFIGFADESVWQYEYQGYMPDKSACCIMKKENKVVGSQAFMPYLLSINQTRVISGRSERTLLDQSVRGGGNFEALMDYCVQVAITKGHQVFWGFTTATKAFKRGGFSNISSVFEHAISVISLANAVVDFFKEKDKKRKYAKAFSIGTWPFLASWAFINQAITGKPRATTIECEPKSGDDIINLYNSLCDSGDVHLVQDSRFVNWAYSMKGCSFKRYYAYHLHELIGYVAIDVSDSSLPQICDFAFKDKNTFVFLWKQAKKDLKKAHVPFIKTSFNYRNQVLLRMARYFYFNGFVPFYRGGNMVVRSADERYKIICGDVSKWYITPLWLYLFKRE
jgi:hypothetical protein